MEDLLCILIISVPFIIGSVIAGIIFTYIIKNTLQLLPAFDEYIISYKDRTASLPPEHNKKVVSNNGIFRPVIVHNGQVIGMWTKEMKKDNAIITASAFKGFDKTTKTLIQTSAELYGSFLERNIEVVFESAK